MDIKGFVEIEVRNSITNELLESRSINNLIFDSYRVIYFFNHYGSIHDPRITFDSMYLYLSNTPGPITQTFVPTYYVRTAGIITPVISYPIDRKQILYTYPTQVFAGVTPTKNLTCVGLQDTSSAVFYTACPIDPPIVHNISTTVYIHYYISITLDDNDNLFGYETLLRETFATKYYFGSVTVGDYSAYTIAMANYKKHFYHSFLNRRLIPIDSSYNNLLFTLPTVSSTDDSSYDVMKGRVIIPQVWSGPYGGSYELRNSGLGAGCIYDPHISRVFAHMSSISNKIFYDSTEADVPESEGTLTTDASGTTLKYPSAFRILFTTQGDVNTAEYNLQEYIMPDCNTFIYPSGHFDSIHWVNFNYNLYTLLKHIYVSGNRDWRAYTTTAYNPTGGNLQDKPYIYVGYRDLVRPYLGYTNYTASNSYCINNGGILYHTRATSTATTIVYSVDLNSLEPTPPLVTEFDLSTACPGHGITNILGLCVDDDQGWLWVATNVGFVRVDIWREVGEVSGESGYYSGAEFSGAGYERVSGAYELAEWFVFFDHNTVDFGAYMSGVNNVVLYDAWNGRFQAERGTLTWIQFSNPAIVWHWTGDRDARYTTVSAGVSNMFVDLDINIIGVVRNSQPADLWPTTVNPAAGTAYPAFIRIGNVAEGLVITHNSTQNINTGLGYSCGMELGQFWYISSLSGGGYRGRIDIVGATGATYTLYHTVGYVVSNYVTTGPSYWNSSNHFASPNRSIVEGVATICVSIGSGMYWQNIMLTVDVGPIYWGWDGSEWIKSLANQPSKVTHSALEEIPRNILVGFNDGGIGDSFRLNDYYSFGVNPKGLYFDNLQSGIVNVSMYGWHANVVTRTITVPVGNIYTIPEASETTTETMSFTRSSTAGGQDYIHDGLVSIASVTQGATTYVAGVDYTVSVNNINWSLGGAEPVAGSSYSVTFTFNPFVYMVAWMGDSHPRVTFLDLSGDPLGTVISLNPAWASGFVYYEGWCVTYGSYNYRCILYHSSAAGNTPGTGGGATYWQQFSLTVAATLEVRYDYAGTITFYPGHAGESVEVRYAWMSKVIV